MNVKVGRRKKSHRNGLLHAFGERWGAVEAKFLCSMCGQTLEFIVENFFSL